MRVRLVCLKTPLLKHRPGNQIDPKRLYYWPIFATAPRRLRLERLGNRRRSDLAGLDADVVGPEQVRRDAAVRAP